MTPENKILLNFINNRFENSDFAEFSPENWNTFVSEAGRHRIASLIYHKVRAAQAEQMIPESVLQKFREKYLATVYRNTVLYHQLTELLILLTKKDIPVLILKGLHLAEFVYKNIALRPMSDLDILVKTEDLKETVKTAFAAGYRFFYDKKNAAEKCDGRYLYDILKYYKHFQPLMHPETKCLLEIHCFISEVGSPFQIPMSELWRSSVPAILHEKAVFLLSHEDLIIHLCLHISYDHLFNFGIGALYDVSIIITQYGETLDWDVIQRRSKRWGAIRCLLLVLYFAKKYLNTSIPDKILENFRIDEIVCLAEERLFHSSETPSLHPHYIQWRNRKFMKDKMRYAFDVLFPSRNFMVNRYIKSKYSKLIFSTYFFRCLQVFKGLFAIAKIVFQDSDYASRLKGGDNDFLLREWLIKS